MGNYSVEESDYKADQQICDRYITFSSELLRLSLIAIGGYGTLVTIFLKEQKGNLQLLRFSWGLTSSVIFFCLCAGATLVHRFFASDSMAWYLSYLRAANKEDNEKQKEEKAGFHRTLFISRWALISAEFLFGIGVILFITGFYQLLFCFPTAAH